MMAVDKACLDIQDGEFMVIVGPSGCGKTTSLRMVAGLEEITSGDIFIGDRRVNGVAPKDRDIAMVFQNYALYPHMSVYKNMAFGLKLRKVPKPEIDKIIQEKAKLLGIDHLLDRKPKALSGGQRQRVALGRALVRDPKVFLYDEPLSNLDAKLRVSTRAELKALHYDMQTTSIYVTHDQAEAMTLGDRICVMQHALVQQVAKPMEIYDRPANRFVAGFLGTPTMNFFDGKVTRESGTLYFTFGSQKIALPESSHSSLGELVDRDAVLGVRPEHLSPHNTGGFSGNRIQTMVQVIEPLGDKTEVHLAAEDGPTLTATVDPHEKLTVGEPLEMYIAMDRIHLFEPGEMGKTVYSAID